MKYLIITFALLTGCSHAYVREFSQGSIVACCPTHKVFCGRANLDSFADKQCHGHAIAQSGNTIATGVQTDAYAGGSQYFVSASSNSRVTHDMCISYQCSSQGEGK